MKKLSEIFKEKIKQNTENGAEYFANEITPKIAFRFLQYCDNVFYYDSENERFVDPGSDEVYTFEQVWEYFLNNVKFE